MLSRSYHTINAKKEIKKEINNVRLTSPSHECNHLQQSQKSFLKTADKLDMLDVRLQQKDSLLSVIQSAKIIIVYGTEGRLPMLVGAAPLCTGLVRLFVLVGEVWVDNVGACAAASRTVPFAFRFVSQPDTVEVKPLDRTLFVVTADHLTV